jgi:hypothetical protein
MRSGQLFKRISGTSCLLLSLLLVCLPALSAAGQETTASANSYSAEAAAVHTNVLGVKTSVSDTGSVGASGGERHSSALTFRLPNLVAGEVAHATAFAEGNVSASEASMAHLHMTVGGNIVASSFLAAHAHARCTATGVIVSADPNIIGLTVNGQPVQISGKPNQTIPLPNGRIIINEQAKASTKTSGHISVSALHIVIDGIADVALSEANAGISCPSGPETCGNDDFSTGGGFIVRSGANANFGVAGGIGVNGNFIGHLEYIDHSPNGTRVHGTSVTGYTRVNATTRAIDGTARVNGQAGFTFHLVVTDDDSSGIDSFSIQLSNGYSASGNLMGGHIEIHGGCDSDDD